jgi:hypothetical protein
VRGLEGAFVRGGYEFCKRRADGREVLQLECCRRTVQGRVRRALGIKPRRRRRFLGQRHSHQRGQRGHEAGDADFGVVGPDVYAHVLDLVDGGLGLKARFAAAGLDLYKPIALAAKGHSAQPGMFWRTHHTESDPKSMRVMPLCLWGV